MWGPVSRVAPAPAAYTEEQATAYAFGEAAYAIVTQQLGYECLQISIDPKVRETSPYSSRGLWRRRVEEHEVEEHDCEDSVSRMRRDRIATRLAVPIAVCAASDDPQLNATAARDFEAVYFSAVGVAERADEDPENVFNEARERVGRILRENKKVWIRLANALLEARNLDRVRIAEIVCGDA
jgi:hypothetical protein